MFDLKNSPAWLQLVAFGLLTAFSAILFAGIGSIGGLIFWSSSDMTLAVSGAENLTSNQLNFLRFFQGISHFGLFTFPSLIFCFLIKKNIGKYLYLSVNKDITYYLLTIILVFFSMPLVGLLGELNSMMKLPEFLSGLESWMKETEEKAALLTSQIAKVNSLNGLLVNIFIMALLPAIGEEFLFRGILLRFTYKFTKRIHLSVIIIAFLFSAIHMQFYGFLPRFALGMVLGYLFVWTGSLWIPILYHFVNNSMAVIAFYLSANGKLSADPENIGTLSQSYYWLLLLPGFIVAMYWLYKNRVKQNVFQEIENREEKILE